MAPDKLEKRAQFWYEKFECRLFISKFSQFAIYLSPSLSVISTILAHHCCKCFNVMVGITLNVRFTTKEMCTKSKTQCGANKQ